MSSLADIKKTLDSNWSKWDADGDGKLTSKDFMKSYDNDGDGLLSTDEVGALAEQLSTQLDYNNNLLEQMQELEEMQLAGQRELQSKQDQLRQVVQANDQLAADLIDTKRKLKITQEIADSMSEQCRDARVEANSLKRENDNASKSHEEGKKLLKNLSDECAALKSQLKKVTSELHNEEESHEQDRVDMHHQNDVLRQSHEALSIEAAELRAKVIPLESEKRQLKEHILALGHSLEETTQKCNDEAALRAKAEKTIKELTNASESLRDKHREMQYAVQQANGKTEATKESVKQLEAQVDNLEDQLAESDKKITNLTQQLQNSNKDKDSLEQELEQMGNELVVQAKQRQLDQERWSAKLLSAKAEMEQAAQETKSHAESFAMEAQRRAQEALDAQRLAEEKYLSVQSECGDLHSLIQQAQIDHQSSLEGWEAQQEDLENTIAQLEKKLELSGEEIEHVHSTMIDERERAQKHLGAVKAEMGKRGERYVAMLETLQMAIKRLKEDSLASREQVREVVAQFAVLGSFCEQLWEKTHPPLENWKTELSVVFSKVIAKVKNGQETIEDYKDDVRRAQLAKEEERSKSLMLEENVSRLEHEIASKDNGVKDADARAKEKLDAQKAKIEGLMNDRSDLEMRLQRLQQSLDAATSQARTLQYSNHNIQTTLGDSSAKQSALKQEAHGKLNEVTSQLKRVTQERDNEQNLRNELQKTLDAMRANIEEANVIKEQSKAEMAKQKADMEAALNRHNAAMNSAGTTAGQYQNQLKQTQELLKVVQAQRAELQNQCKTLRSELDTAYKKNAVAQDDDDEE